MDRRALLERIAAAGAAFWTGDTLAVEMAKAVADRPAAAPSGAVLPKAMMATLAALADLIIPATRTAGAVKAGVPVFVADMYAEWLNDVERERFRSGLEALDADAKDRFGRPFTRCNVKQKTEAFGALRATLADYKSRGLGARIADQNAPFFHKARDLVTLGYFTSELGITQELAYVPAPARFDGDVDVKSWNRQMQL